MVRTLVPIALLLVLLIAGGALAVSFFSARDESSVRSGEMGPGHNRVGTPPPGVDMEALAQGNVVLTASDGQTIEALEELSLELAGEDDPALRAVGQAVIVKRVPDVDGVRAFGADRTLQVDDPRDPQLRRFVRFWLGRAEGS